MRHVIPIVSHCAAHPRGFTFIELVVAIAIVATLVGLLAPAAQDLRTSRNAAAATATLGEVRAAQETFRTVDHDGDGALEYAGSLRELVDAGLLDDDLGDGRRQGYAFETATQGQSAVGYGYVATPMNQGQTGVRGFAGDAGGIFTSSCPPGEHLALADGTVVCVRDGNPPPLLRLPIGEASGIAAIDAAALLSDAPAVDRARTLLTGEFAADVAAEFDADGDGLLSFDELLHADLLAMTRRLASMRSLPGGSVTLGDDQALDAILRGLQGRLAQDLALGSENESAPPPAPSCSAVGYPRVVLDQASVARVRASLTVLLDLVHGLDPAPGAGQMTSPDEETNLQRQRRLVDFVDTMIALWGTGSLAELRDVLAGVRRRADGSPNPPDWIQGPAALRIRARVDATAALLAEVR
jgi:prepilin-type N-terminal cleavage/methylation domain-containing protein